ncbi:MAG: efflux RND transporter periplasmic adaptor subunit [Bryobacterales bacterium]
MSPSARPEGMMFSVPASLPEPNRQATPPVEAPEPPEQQKKGKYGWLIVLLGLGLGALIYTLTDKGLVQQAQNAGASLRTATVATGKLDRSLRVGGTIAAKNFAAIRAPRLRGPGDTGRAGLILMHLAEPGSMVKAGDVVAKFELKWLEDHIDDRRSAMIVSESQVDKRRAEQLITLETDRQAAVTAKAEWEKAKFDLKTAEVRSEIEAEVLKNLAQQAEAAFEQLEQQLTLEEEAHNAELEALKITVQEDKLHLDRHLRDFERMEITSPVSGLVVMEPQYRGGGQISQTEEGDQVYPGSLFMRVVDLSKMVLTAYVNQVDVQKVRVGQMTDVHLDAYPDLSFQGKVVSIGAIAEAGSGSPSGFRFGGGSGLFLKTIPIDIEITSDDERVIPDLSASADIHIETDEEGLIAPREAVRSEGDQSVVFVRNGGKIERRVVEVGRKSDTHVIVLSGLSAGDEVLLEAPPQPEA